MFNLRNCLNICAKLYRLPTESFFIHKVIKYRQFRTSAAVGEKVFINHENIFAHGILESNAKCTVLRGEQNVHCSLQCEDTDFDFNRNWSDLTADEILTQLRLIGSYCKRNGISISDERFDKFVDVCTERCFEFTDDQLIKTLQILMHYPQTESPRSRNFVELWKALDDACVARIGGWSYDTILYVCDHWSMLNLAKFNKFNMFGSLKIGRKLRKLPPHQLVQMMFYINVKRSPVVEMFAFESNLMNSIDKLTLNEIAVMCMGFFKTETKIKTIELTSKIFERLIREIDTVQDIPLTCILKTLRYSSNIAHLSLILSLLDAATDQITRLSPLSCLHLALLGTQLHICHQNTIEGIVRRFADDVTPVRMKDFERITFVMGLFNFESESGIEDQLCQKIFLELKNRVNEIVKHPRCFPLCLNYLTMKGYHDEELINTALSRPFLNFAYGNQTKYGRELFGLDSYAKINLKGTYDGNELSEKNRQYMGKMLTQYVPDRSGKFKVSATDAILLDLKDTCEEICGHCYFAHALPHFDRPDIIIAYDTSANTGIDIAHNFPELYQGKIIDRSMLIEGLNMDTSKVEIINVIVGGWANFVRITKKLNGLTKLKIEQSKIVGFRPVLIPWFDWTRLHAGEREFYVKQKIVNALQQK